VRVCRELSLVRAPCCHHPLRGVSNVHLVNNGYVYLQQTECAKSRRETLIVAVEDNMDMANRFVEAQASLAYAAPVVETRSSNRSRLMKYVLAECCPTYLASDSAHQELPVKVVATEIERWSDLSQTRQLLPSVHCTTVYLRQR
jgi:hypothetical protein